MEAKLNEVVSSNIKSIGHVKAGLVVEYKSGSKYLYKGVTEDVYKRMLLAESKGRFMNAEIKGKYEYEKLI